MKSQRSKMTIDAPLALIGDAVMARNYRMRPAAWERAEVLWVSFTPAQVAPRRDGGTYNIPAKWTYEVWISRPVTIGSYGRRRGGGYRMRLGEDDVRPA